MTAAPGSGTPSSRRRARREEIVRATRDLFDARGVRDASIDDIARAVGVNRAIIYRHFGSKDELFALTLTGYLRELDALLERAVLDAARHPRSGAGVRLAALVDAFAGYALAHPAFLDSAQWLLRQPRDVLAEEMRDGSLHALGQLMVTGLGRLSTVLREGAAAGDLVDGDADLLAMALFAQGLGALQLARCGYFVGGDGTATLVPLAADAARRLVVRHLVASVTRTRS